MSVLVSAAACDLGWHSRASLVLQAGIGQRTGGALRGIGSQYAEPDARLEPHACSDCQL